jgi:cyclohexanone monooxygenase
VDQAGPDTETFDAVVVGAGFAGLYAIYKLRELGLTVRAYETGGGVGGTWYWNRYPGARCDTPSMEYSYEFDEALEQEWEWTEFYPGQPEILRYAEHVAERFGLYPHLRFDTRVTAARYDEAAGLWRVKTSKGDAPSARFLVMAVGCLSTVNMPDMPGLKEFQGELYHTGAWPHEGVDLKGKRVGVIGTGSSGVQSIPEIARQAAELTVFQRTPQFSIPARNRPLPLEEQAKIKADYRSLRARNRLTTAGFGADWNPNPVSVQEYSPEERRERFEARWETGGFGFMSAFGDLSVNRESNAIAADFVRGKIREIVKDPEVAAKLMPTQVIGCKRLVLDTDYFATYNLPHVKLVDLSAEPIETITRDGLRAGGKDYPLDVLVFATGFDAMTGSLLSIDLRDRGGADLKEAWSAGPITYLGLGIPGFPNLFTICGPGSPSVLANMIAAIQQHVEWIGDCIAWLRDKGYASIEATPEAAEAWVGHVNAVASRTLYPTCNSWYLGANVPGKVRVFMPLPGLPPYREKCQQVADAGYEGFAFRPSLPRRRSAVASSGRSPRLSSHVAKRTGEGDHLPKPAKAG